jgi:hypothetical protein
MVDEIEGIGRKRKSDEPMIWKPWQPPPGYVPPSKPDDAVGGVTGAGPVARGPKPRIAGDRNGTGPLAVEAATRWLNQVKPIDLDSIAIPEAAGTKGPNGPAGKVGEAAKALGELGVIASLTQVAAAYTQTRVNFADMASSLEAFAGNMSRVSEQLAKVPGASEALAAFGGVGGIVSGVMGFKEELDRVKQDGLNLGNGLGAAASAAQLVGGVATALGALCPPLAPVGASIMAAGAALKLGKLGWENRDKARSAAEGAIKVISDKGAAIVGNNGAAIISNNGANMVGDRSFNWITG